MCCHLPTWTSEMNTKHHFPCPVSLIELQAAQRIFPRPSILEDHHSQLCPQANAGGLEMLPVPFPST